VHGATILGYNAVLTECTAVVDRFQDKEFDTLDNEPIDILLSTYTLMGTGLTSTRARRVIMMDPANTSKEEQQALARVNRANQTSGITFSHHWFSSISTFEWNVVQMQGPRTTSYGLSDTSDP